jgi:hypothetical protein
MKILQGFLIFMGVVAVLAIMALIIGYVLALLTPDIRSSMRPVVLSSEAVDSMDKKMSNLRKEVTAAQSTQTATNIELVLTEEEVNSTLVMMLAEGTLPAKEILTNFNDGYLMIYTAWNFPGLPLKTGVIGQIEIDGGKPKFIVKDFYLGTLPIPNSVDSGVQVWANMLIKINVPLEELKLDLKEVTIGDGQIIIKGVTRVAK